MGIKFLPPIFRSLTLLFAVLAVDTALLALALALLIAFAKTGFVVVVLPLLNVMCDLVQIYFPDSQFG